MNTRILGLAAALLTGCIPLSDDPEAGAPGDAGLDAGSKDAGDSGSVIDKPSVSITQTTVSGYVRDERGKPLFGAQVTTDPPTGSVSTNLSGLYSLGAGQSFGVVTVKASKGLDYFQQAPVCVSIRPGNTLADLTLIRKDLTPGEGDCFPPCTGATSCFAGTCVSACNPACSCDEICSLEGGAPVCKEDPTAPSFITCGANSHLLGSGLCECDPGFVPSGDGRSCVSKASLEACPTGSTLTEGGCTCKPGLVPDAAGEQCLDPQDAVTVGPLASGAIPADHIVHSVPAPGPAPRGLAFDGSALWVGDAAHQKVYRMHRDGEVVGEIDLGPMAKTLLDLTFANGALYLSFSSDVAVPGSVTPVLARLDLTSGELTRLPANQLLLTEGLTFDGNQLASLEGLVVRRRTLELAQDAGSVNVLLSPTAQTPTVKPPRPLRLLAYSRNQLLTWSGTFFDGTTYWPEIVLLNGAHQLKSAELARIRLPVGGSHLAGLEAVGSTLWVVVAGSGHGTPKVVELSLD